MTRHYLDGSGKARVSGGRDLKSSQAYPMRPGLKQQICVIQVWFSTNFQSGIPTGPFLCQVSNTLEVWDSSCQSEIPLPEATCCCSPSIPESGRVE